MAVALSASPDCQSIFANRAGLGQLKPRGFGQSVDAHRADRCLTFGTQSQACSESDQLINQVCFQQRSCHRAAAFAEYAGQTLVAERR